ncbi:hypothetical protein Ahy_A03g016274 isoform C [Arachis hypogaea]|uniref:Uncharacterized protein n=1 Tax=Arachis hypogaea TaxID=3818 RepID=A0A445E2Q1_ARAHY|nr:hypothetical protein Ahy_A03g016274 isoform C [Arachis hypogaea]
MLVRHELEHPDSCSLLPLPCSGYPCQLEYNHLNLPKRVLHHHLQGANNLSSKIQPAPLCSSEAVLQHGNLFQGFQETEIE